MVALRDGRKLIGVLRSWDQFGIATILSSPSHLPELTIPANLVLQSTIERIFVPPSPPTPGLYADIPRGIFLVRGENVLLLGEIDLDKDDDVPPGYERADVEVVKKLEKERREKEGVVEKRRLAKLRGMGFEGENRGEALI
jgi:U6 snRNA-associated Sm-like protein LSm1